MSTASGTLILAAALSAAGGTTVAQERERLIEVARAVMQAAGYCALITLDSEGRPQARAMEPFPPGADLSVWMATHATTRKIAEIEADRRATLYYFDREGGGYVTLLGQARVVRDAEAKARLWKPEWNDFYDAANRGDDYVLIEFLPHRVEIVSLEHGVAAEPKGWKPAVLQLRRPGISGPR